MLAAGRAQVSMNLIDLAATPLHVVVAEVARQAAAEGIDIHGSELVGLMPASVAAAAAGAGLHLPGMAADRLLEVAVARRLRGIDSCAVPSTVELTGHDLTVADVEAVARGDARVSSRRRRSSRSQASRALIERVVPSASPPTG